MPAVSPAVSSSTSTVMSWALAQREYMRISISAQSADSVPPAPELIST